jgi:hypothetical protein
MNKTQKVIRLARESDVATLRWRQKAEPHAMRKVWHA